MNKKEIEIIKDILEKYIELSKYKEIFNNKYFIYEEKEIKNIIENIKESTEIKEVENSKEVKANKKNSKKTEKKKPTKTDKHKLIEIKDEAAAEKYYNENLKYKHSEIDGREKVTKKLTADEFKYLYKILFNIEPGRKNKGQLLDDIERYFENKNRSLNIKV